MTINVVRLRRAPGAAALATALAVVVGLLVPGPAAAAPSVPLGKDVRFPCAAQARHGDDAQCLVAVRSAPPTRTPVVSPAGAGRSAAASGVLPVNPAQLRAIYGVAGATAPAGTTVGIVVAFDAPSVEADLSTFRSTFGLSPCTTANGCFRKVDQRGARVPAGKAKTIAPVYRDANWELETTLDTQAVSAMCPSCKILLVEADSTSLTNSLGPAVARAQALGATVISNSFAGGESGDMVAAERDYWSKLTVPVFAGAGDHGWNNLNLPSRDPAYNHANFPASSPSVVAVGGTSATISGNTVTAEAGWSGSGSGCSDSFPRPTAQTDYFTAAGTRPDAPCTTTDAGLPARAVADLSALADPDKPGFSIYRGGSWIISGGTSLAVQLVAALAAYAGVRGAQTTPVATVAYELSAQGASTGLVDITKGTNLPDPNPQRYSCATERICNSVAGWDGLTGLGTPRGLSVFAPLLTTTPGTSVAGGTVSLAGSNWFPGEQVQFTTTNGFRLGLATVSAAGGFSGFDVTVPQVSSGSVPITATGVTSQFTSTVAVTIAPHVVTPAQQTVTSGAPATLRLTGFAAGEAVTATADTGGTGTDVATGTTDATGATTLSWTPTVNGTERVVVSGAVSGAVAPVRVAVVKAGASLPDAPTVLSAVPTTLGGAVVGVRVATTGPRPTTVAVLGSDGSLSPRATVSASGDAFAEVPTLAAGSAVTYTAVAGNVGGDSAPSAPSLTVTGSTDPGTGDLTPVGPVRRIDSRSDGGPLGPGATRTVQIAGTAGVPADGVAAVVVSLTLVNPTARTYLTLWPSDEARPGVSNANTAGAGGTKASLAKVKLGAGGAISIYNFAGSSDFILDVVGYFAAGPEGSATTSLFAHNQSYAATTPVRVADTRGVADSPVRTGGSIVVPIRNGVSGVRTGVPADANSVELIVQSVNATTSGYVTVYPTGRAGGVPRVSNVQSGVGKPVATAVVATLGADGTVTVFAQAHTDVIVDVVGYYAGSADGRFTPVSPRRYYDSRGLGPFGGGVSRTVAIAGARVGGAVPVPADATSVSFSLTSTDNSASTYVTAWRAGTTRPTVTTLLPNPARGVFDNLALAGVGTNGAVVLYNNGGTVNLIVDVQGYYTDGPP